MSGFLRRKEQGNNNLGNFSSHAAQLSSSSQPSTPPSSKTSTLVPSASFPCLIMLSSCALKASTRKSVSRSAASFFCASCLASASRCGLAWISLISMPVPVLLRAVGAADAMVGLRRWCDFVGESDGTGDCTWPRLCRLEGRDKGATLVPLKAKGLGDEDETGTGMRLGVPRVTGERGAAKLAGSRVATFGDPVWDIRRDARLRGRDEAGGPLNLETGTLMRLAELAAVGE